MKDIFRIKHFLALFMLLIFISCEKKDNNLSRTLLIEQSKDLTLANQGELNGLLSGIAAINLKEKKETSEEYEKIWKLCKDLENFKLSIEKADRKKVIKMITEQNMKFKNDDAFKIKGHFEFKPEKAEELKQLDDEVFKYYVESKISRFYLQSAAYIFVTRKYGREEL